MGMRIASLSPFLLLLSLSIAITSGSPRKDLHSRFFQEENLEKHQSNDIGDLLTRYKSEPKLNKILFGNHGGRFRKTKKGNKHHKRKSQPHLTQLLGHRGEQVWRRDHNTHGDIRFQDLSFEVRDEIPEAVRMTPNRIQHHESIKKTKNSKAEKKAAHMKRAHHLEKIKSLGKNVDDKALWKWINKRAKQENRRQISSSSTP